MQRKKRGRSGTAERASAQHGCFLRLSDEVVVSTHTTTHHLDARSEAFRAMIASAASHHAAARRPHPSGAEPEALTAAA